MAAYCIYALGKFKRVTVAQGDLKFWASTILIFIGIGIVAMIVIQIIFHILLSIAMAVKDQVQNGKCDDKEIEKTIEVEMVEDEMDKLIELKSMRIGFIFVGVGFVLASVSLVLDYSPAVMLNICLFLSASVAMIEGFTQLYYYRRHTAWLRNLNYKQHPKIAVFCQRNDPAGAG